MLLPLPRHAHIHVYVWLLALLFRVLPAAGAATNISIANSSPQIVFTPFVCEDASALASDPECSGAWNATNIAGRPTIRTRGPALGGSNIVPQMFMVFRASALYLSTSVESTAIANFTVSSKTGTATQIVDTSAGLVAIINLDESVLTSLVVTFVPGTNASVLDIGSILLTVSDSTATSSFLPTMTLPPSMSLPTFVLPTTSAGASSTSTPRTLAHREQIALALSIVLGVGVGLSVIAAAIFLWWRKRRRRKQRETQTWF
ncbi:hypothetical protein MKEN_00868000 [Mycena kentingensis (nom. inval.)]|nr:hypothetical protein MKEN_00868000 [Mycena kentingensis (nom. inval.)]